MHTETTDWSLTVKDLWCPMRKVDSTAYGACRDSENFRFMQIGNLDRYDQVFGIPETNSLTDISLPFPKIFH